MFIGLCSLTWLTPYSRQQQRQQQKTLWTHGRTDQTTTDWLYAKNGPPAQRLMNRVDFINYTQTRTHTCKGLKKKPIQFGRQCARWGGNPLLLLIRSAGRTPTMRTAKKKINNKKDARLVLVQFVLDAHGKLHTRTLYICMPHTHMRIGRGRKGGGGGAVRPYLSIVQASARARVRVRDQQPMVRFSPVKRTRTWGGGWFRIEFVFMCALAPVCWWCGAHNERPVPRCWGLGGVRRRQRPRSTAGWVRRFKLAQMYSRTLRTLYGVVGKRQRAKPGTRGAHLFGWLWAPAAPARAHAQSLTDDVRSASGRACDSIMCASNYSCGTSFFILCSTPPTPQSPHLSIRYPSIYSLSVHAEKSRMYVTTRMHMYSLVSCQI